MADTSGKNGKCIGAIVKPKIDMPAGVNKMHCIINVGLLLRRIREKNLVGFSQAAAYCQTSSKKFHKLSRGELPRLDALQRICKGLGIAEDELIVGMSKSKPTEPAEVVEIGKGLVS